MQLLLKFDMPHPATNVLLPWPACAWMITSFLSSHAPSLLMQSKPRAGLFAAKKRKTRKKGNFNSGSDGRYAATLPGTPLHDRIKREGRFVTGKQGVSGGAASSPVHTNIKPKNMTYEELAGGFPCAPEAQKRPARTGGAATRPTLAGTAPWVLLIVEQRFSVTLNQLSSLLKKF
jgi:hypothetical protein